MSGYSCPRCYQPTLRFIYEYQQWWCDRCQAYLPQPPPPAQTAYQPAYQPEPTYAAPASLPPAQSSPPVAPASVALAPAPAAPSPSPATPPPSSPPVAPRPSPSPAPGAPQTSIVVKGNYVPSKVESKVEIKDSVVNRANISGTEPGGAYVQDSIVTRSKGLGGSAPAAVPAPSPVLSAPPSVCPNCRSATQPGWKACPTCGLRLA